MKGAEQYILFWGFEGGRKLVFLDSTLIIWHFSQKIVESLGQVCDCIFFCIFLSKSVL